MKASELIQKLTELKTTHGDLDIVVSAQCGSWRQEMSEECKVAKSDWDERLQVISVY